jgi:hypothetical protein
LEHALIFNPLPFVQRVFVAMPHRGSYQALGFFGGVASWLVNLPGNLTGLAKDKSIVQSLE